MHSESRFQRSSVIFTILTAVLMLCPSTAYSDCENNFVSLEVARAYLKENPYLIAFYSSIEGQTSYLFKVEKVYMEEERMTVSGPVILKWKENEYRQRTYSLPDTGEIFTDELCANYHYGYYRPMRAAVPLGDLLCPTGGIYNYNSSFWAFPEPEVLPDVEKSYASWLEQLPEATREYCQWWYENASAGPPVLHELIDSVLSIPEGGRKKPPENYVDYDHCPGEGCQLGEWTGSVPIEIFDRPERGKRTGEIPAGETFTAITGNVYLRPLEMIAYEPVELYDTTGSVILEPGRKYYILSNIGEGHSKAWVNGRIMIDSQGEYNPTQKWWVEVKTKNGKKGWILYPEDGSISGADYLE